jgi:hypothetical protein
MITVFFPISAARTPVAAAIDVLPVPPFPAKNMILTGKLLACYGIESRRCPEVVLKTPTFRIQNRLILELNKPPVLLNFYQTEQMISSYTYISMNKDDFTSYRIPLQSIFGKVFFNENKSKSIGALRTVLRGMRSLLCDPG